MLKQKIKNGSFIFYIDYTGNLKIPIVTEMFKLKRNEKKPPAFL